MKKTYTKAVSATLASALAVGMVPAMALADETPVQAELADDVADYKGGKISIATDDEGAAIDLSKAVKLTLDADGAYVVPAQVTTKSGTVIDLTDEEVALGYKVAYYKVNANGQYNGDGSFAFAGTDRFDIAVSSTEDPADYAWTAGTYYAAVWDITMSSTEAVAVKFTVESAALSGVTVAEKSAINPKDVSDTKFVYKAAAFTTSDFVLAKDGVLFDGATVNCFYRDGMQPTVTNAISQISVTKTGLGKYYAEIEGKAGTVYAGQKAYVPFEIEAYDLAADLDLGIADTAWADAVPTSADIINHDLAANKADLMVVETPLITKVGPYNATIKAKNDESVVILNSKTVPFNVVGETLDDDRFYVGGSVIREETVTIDLSKKADKAKLFDIDSVEVLLPGKQYDAVNGVDEADLVDENEISVIVTDAKGKVVDPSSVLTAGTWKVTVKALDGDYAFGGSSATITYVIYDGTIDADAEAFVKFEGKTLTAAQIAAGIETTYDGQNVVEDIDTVVLSGKKTLVAGADYAVKYERKDAKLGWVEVSEIVNAGDYRMTISSTSYKEAATGKALKETLDIKVNPLTVKAVFVNQLAGEVGYDALYTGAEMSPIAKFMTYDEDGELVELPEGVAVAATDYKITISKFYDQDLKDYSKVAPKVFMENGDYTFTLADVDTPEGNFNVESEKNVEFTIDGRNVFVDVASGKWYAPYIYQLADAGIVGGYGKGIFDPNGSLDREDAAVIMGRLAGEIARVGEIDNDADPDKDAVLTHFEDVVANAYYAEAVDWAYKNKIMGVNTGDIFGVDKDITRQEIITVLYRYDQQGLGDLDDTILYANAIDAYADADEVSAWAVEAMNWAVENGIAGVNTAYLNPGDDITRAEFCAMVARYCEMKKLELPSQAYWGEY